MERIPAACAMNWSVDLEKGLRIKKGQEEDVINQLAPRLLSWSQEPCVSLSALKIYDLIPGEERTFANTILTRLVDAFLSGNDGIRSSILKVFMQELIQINANGKRYKGILSKERLPNYLQLLKRLSLIYDSEDVKARALSVRLLGCWSPLTHDNADVQRVIISGLRSQNLMEMKASLFACGCLSLFSGDFVCAILNILVDIVRSMNLPSNIKLRAARTLGSIQCSSLLASKAYEICKRLVLVESLEDSCRVELLFSLTKLCIKCVILIPSQVDFLLTFMAEDCSGVTKSMVLKCFRFLCFRKMSHFLAKENVLSILITLLDDQKLPLVFQCEILLILRQIFRDPFGPLLDDTSSPQRLVMSIKDAFQSPCIRKRYLSLGLLIDIHRNDKRERKGDCSRTEQFHKVNPLDFLIKEICLLFENKADNEIHLITNLVEDDGWGGVTHDFKEKRRILSNCILRLVQRCPESGLFILNRFRGMIEDKISQIKLKPVHSDTTLESRDPAQNFSEMIISCLQYFIIPYLHLLKQNHQTVPEICTAINLLSDILQNFGCFGSDDLELLSFRLLCCCNIYSMTVHDDKWIGLERCGLRLARKMTSKTKYWMLYKLGKYSCMNGVWFVATYAFKHLIPEAMSDSCRSWLKALILLAGSEIEIRLLLFPDLGSGLVNELCSDVDIERPNEGGDESKKICEIHSVLRQEEIEKLSRAHKRICSSLEVLSSLKTQNGRFWFQTWFLSLRKRGEETVIELLDLLLNLASPSPSANDIHILSSDFMRISHRFNHISGEYDFMIASFMKMDVQSSDLISRLALYYSLLAYFSGFPLYLENSLDLFLLEDFSRRLYDMFGLDLSGHLPFSDWMRDFPSLSGNSNKLSVVSGADEDNLSLSRIVTDSIHHLLKEAKVAKSKEGLGCIFQNYLNSSNSVISKGMSLPFTVPPYFFKLGDSICAELFIVGDKTCNLNGLYTFVGNQLSLHLCIQAKNISSDQRRKICQMHCILAVESAGSECDWLKNIDKTMEMHEQLLLCMRQETNAKFDSSAVTYVRTEANSLGQGFSSCLLNVSSFPEGSYQIIWHGCCVDDDHRLWILPPVNYGIPFSIAKRP